MESIRGITSIKWIKLKTIKLDDYDAIDRKEKEMKDLDTKYCNWVVNNRKYLWT